MATIKGNSSNNNLTGTTGNDFIYGYDGLDTLTGLDGNDTLDGGTGADTMIGGSGDDTYIVDSTSDVITEVSGGGVDTIKTSISYTLNENYVNNLILTGSSNINGTGNSYDNVITGNSGNNILTGAAGIDTLIGGKGDDTYIVDSTSDVIVELPGEGVDTVKSSVSYTLTDNYVNNLVLTGTGNINGGGNSYNNVITGNDGNNTIYSPIGNDTIYGGKGNDTIDAGGDYSNSSAQIYGGDGNDYLSGFGSGINGENGDDEIYCDYSGAQGGAGNDTLGGWASSLRGDSGNDLIGGQMVDIYGGDGDDTLVGNYGYARSAVYGDNGNDLIEGNGFYASGGAGNDTLTCYDREFYNSEEGDEHTIVFNAANEGIDTIIDFSSVRDGLEVSASGFGGGLVAGVLKSNQFTLGAAATNSSHRFIYNTSTGELRFDVDGNGSAAANVLAIFQGAPTLTNSDIYVIA